MVEERRPFPIPYVLVVAQGQTLPVLTMTILMVDPETGVEMPLDLTKYHAHATARKSIGQTTVLFETSDETGGITLDINGQLVMTIPADAPIHTMTPPTTTINSRLRDYSNVGRMADAVGVYELWLEEIATGQKELLMQEAVVLIPTVGQSQ